MSTSRVSAAQAASMSPPDAEPPMPATMTRRGRGAGAGQVSPGRVAGAEGEIPLHRPPSGQRTRRRGEPVARADRRVADDEALDQIETRLAVRAMAQRDLDAAVTLLDAGF